MHRIPLQQMVINQKEKYRSVENGDSGLDEQNWNLETRLVGQDYFRQSTNFWFLPGLKLDETMSMSMVLN